MTTMKDIAKRAGVSVSTVSIVINHHEKERRIPLETVAKIHAIAHDLNYRPNRNARNLRNQQSLKEIAFCWPADFSSGISQVIPDLLTQLELVIQKKKLNWHLVLQTYERGILPNLMTSSFANQYDAMLIGAANKNELTRLEKTDFSCPIILLNRDSQRFNTIGVPPKAIANMAISLFKANDITKFSLVVDDNDYMASNQRVVMIRKAAEFHDIQIDQTYHAHYSYASGVKVASEILMKKDTNPLLVESDLTALGMSYSFNRHPSFAKNPLISLGVLDQGMTRYATPSISTIEIPSAMIAERSIKIIEKLFEQPNQIFHEDVLPKLNLRDSFPPKLK